MPSETSLTVVLRARDQASATMHRFNQGLQQNLTSVVARFTGAIVLIQTAAKLAASAVEMAGAEQARAQAQAKRDIEGVLMAQIRVNEVTGNYAESIPMIGQAISRMLAVWNDTEGLKKQIEALKQLDAAVKGSHDLNRKLAEETAVQEAQLAGKSQSEIEGIKNIFRARDQEATAEDLRASLKAADEAVGKATSAAERQSRQVRQLAEETAGRDWALGAWVLKGKEKNEEVAYQAQAATQKKRGKLAAEVAEYEARIRTDQEQKNALAAKKSVEESEKADKEKAAAAVKLADELQLAQARETAFFESEIDRRVRMVTEEANRIIEERRKRGAATVDVEAELARKVGEIHSQEAAKAAQEAERAGEKQEAEQRAIARDKIALEDVIYAMTATRREQELRTIERWQTEMQEKYQNNAEMLALIEKAAEAKKEAGAGSEAAEARQEPGREVQAFTSRFLSYGPEREQPLTAQEMARINQLGVERMTKKLDDLPERIGKSIQGAFLVMN